MSVTGPGCAACNFTGRVTHDGDERPCDRCGGFSQFARAVAPEDDWRPLPSVAEVLAHNARTGGDCFGPWLMLCESDEYAHGLRVEVIHLGTDGYDLDAHDNDGDRIRDAHRRGALKFRPITRRGAALPWPEVPR